MDGTLKILILEDSPTDAELLERFLKKEMPGSTIMHANNKKSFRDALESFIPEIIISDHSLPQFDSSAALQLARQQNPFIPFILVTGTVSEEFAVNIIKQGADDYILKDRIKRLPAAIATALQKRKSESSIRNSEAIRKLIMNSALDAIVCINTSGRVIVWTPQAEKMFGWKEAEITDKQLTDTIIPLQYREKHFQGMSRYLATGEMRIMNKVVELTALKQSGEEFPVELLVIPIKEDGNEFFCAFIRDITERKKAEEQLLKERNLLRSLIDNLPDYIYIKDKEARFIITNKAFVKLADAPSEAATIGKKVSDLFNEEVSRVNLEEDRQILETGKVVIDREEPIIVHNDEEHWLITTKIPLKDQKGNIIGILGISKDITERKKIEKVLIESEIKYRTLFYKSPLPNWIFDMDTLRFLDVNEAAIYHYGYTREEFLNMTIMDIRPKEDAELILNDLSNIRAGADSRKGNWRHKKKNGEVIYVETTAHSIHFNGRDARIVIANDITEKLKTEEEIRKSNERFLYVTKATSDIIWEQNFITGEYHVHEGKEKLFNGFTEILDWRFGLDGKAIFKEDRLRVKRSFLKAKKDPGRILWKDEYRIHSGDNTILYITNHAIIIRDEKGKALKAYGAISNITERKELEHKLLEQQKAEQLKITATALEAQERERNALAIELHDNVNQILVGIKLILSRIRNNEELVHEIVATSQSYLQIAIDENRKLAHTLVTPDLDTEPFIQQIRRLCKSMLEITGITVTLDISDYNDHLLADKMKIAMYRILQEQCTNIVKYAKASAVKIILRNAQKHFKMSIADNGVGMDTGKITGGIGLRNINSRLSIFNGTAKIDTKPGKGFKLSVEIPL